MGAGVSAAVSEYACEGGFVSRSDCRFVEFEEGIIRIEEVVGTEGVLEDRDRSGALACASAACELLLLLRL